MQQFEVEVRRSSYVTIQVEANNLEDAKEIALEKVEQMFEPDSAEYEVAMAKATREAALIDLCKRTFQLRGGLSFEPMSEVRRSEMDAQFGVSIIHARNNHGYDFGYLYTFLENGVTMYRLEWDYHTPYNPEESTTFLSLTHENVFQFEQNCAFVDSFEAFSREYNKWASKEVQQLKQVWHSIGFSMDTE